MEAPSERPAANVSAASLWWPERWSGQGAVGACVRALLSALVCLGNGGPGGSLRRANPGAAASATAVAAEGKRSSLGSHLLPRNLPGNQRLQQDWTWAPGGTTF